MRRRTRQRGAAAVFAAVSMLAGLIAACLAIDIGRLYFAQRDLQRIASLAALDAARVVGGCFGSPENAEEAALAEALGSVRRNGGSVERRILPDRVEIGRMVTDAAGNRFFEPQTGSRGGAVRVRVQRPAPERLLPFFQGSGAPLERLYAMAAAHSLPTASVMVGSRLSELNPDLLNGLLSDALGGAINLDVLSYRNLFGADIPLGDLLGPLDVGTPDQVLDIEVPARNLIGDLVTALAQTGDAAARAAAEQVAGVVTSTASVLPSQLLFIENTTGSALNGTLINTGALLLSVAQAANGSALLDLPLALPPPLVTGGTRLRVVIPGSQAQLSPSPASNLGGGGFAANGQAVLESDLNLNLPLLGTVALPLWVEVAQTVATVDDIQCARRGQPEDVVTVRARSYASRLGVGRFDDIRAPRPQATAARIFDGPSQLNVLGLPIPVPVRITIDVAATVDIPSEERALEFRSPWPADPQTLGRPQAALLVGALGEIPGNLQIDIDIRVLDRSIATALVTPVVNATRTLLATALRNQLVAALAQAGDTLLQPALSGIGLSVGGADIQVLSMQNDQPYLFSR